MNEEASMESLITQYRQLSQQVKDLEARKDELKSRIEPLVQATESRKWQDDDGHAMMKSRSESVSYPGKEVDNLVQSWTQSEDSIMKSCGQMLQNLRKVKSASEYLEIK